jgi:hypothetical protein
VIEMERKSVDFGSLSSILSLTSSTLVQQGSSTKAEKNDKPTKMLDKFIN